MTGINVDVLCIFDVYCWSLHPGEGHPSSVALPQVSFWAPNNLDFTEFNMHGILVDLAFCIIAFMCIHIYMHAHKFLIYCTSYMVITLYNIYLLNYTTHK